MHRNVARRRKLSGSSCRSCAGTAAARRASSFAPVAVMALLMMSCSSPRRTIWAAEDDGHQPQQQPSPPQQQYQVLAGQQSGQDHQGGDDIDRSIRGLGGIAAVGAAAAAASDNATCLSPRGRLVRCFDDMGIFREYCDRCVAMTLPTQAVVSCRELGEIMCAAIHTRCPCGLCSDEIEAFLDCAFRAIVGCPLDCPKEGI